MTDQDLPLLLERVAAGVDVGPAPVEQVLRTRTALRIRRRRRAGIATTLLLTGAIAVALGPVLSGPGEKDPTTVPSPDGTRQVGVGRLVADVPDGWATNAAQCGTPQRDTVIINVSVIEACAAAPVRNVESLEIDERRAVLSDVATVPDQIDGLEVERVPTTCSTSTPEFGDDREPMPSCSGALYFPEDDVTFTATSTTDRASVDRLLATVHVDRSQVGVPAYGGLIDLQERSGDAYLERLTDLGLDVEVKHVVERSIPGGFVRSVDPAVGTVVKPGSRVVVTISGDRSRLIDQVELNVSAWPEGQELMQLDDEQTRAGGTLTVPVGTGVWAPVSGPRADAVVAELDGDSLADNWKPGQPNPGRTWVSEKPGTTVVRMYLLIDGERTDLGHFRIVVTG